MTLTEVLEKHNVGRVRCGADCGDGWAPLVDKALTKLAILKWEGKIEQIKEKFGGLTIYITNNSTETGQILCEAMSESYKVCESCGKPGYKQALGGWIVTSCPECFDRKVEERANRKFND